MGYSIAASLGAIEKARPGQQVICLIGDGGLQMNIQELQTIKHYDLKIKIIVMNNKSLGAIKEFQDDNFESNYFATDKTFGYSAPAFYKVAEAYGLKSRKPSRGTSKSAIESELHDFLTSDETLFEIEISESEKMVLSLEKYD